MMSGNVQYSLPDGQMSLHISDALVANSASSDLTTHVKDDPAVELGRSSDYHLKTRSKTSVFNCDVCERTFESAEFLSSHVLSHSLDIGAYSCEICHKVFNEKHDLSQHKCLQHTDMHSQNLIQDNNAFHPQTNVPRGDINGPYGCVSGIGNDEGGSGGHGMDGEYIGLNSQKGMQLFACEYCEKKFKTNSALLIHRRSHTGETPYPCEFCGKSFRQSAHLDVHMRIHTGEMPYKCAYCDKSFTQKNNRNRHQLLHLNPNGPESNLVGSTKPHNEHCLDAPTAPSIGNMPTEPARHFSYENTSMTTPPAPPPAQVGANYPQPNQLAGSSQFSYQCNVCQKVYSNNSALIQHMQIHNKDQSFDCYVCNHKFKQRAHLETHLRVHTHEMPFKCQYCDKSFSQKGNKNRHERLHLLNDTADPSGTLLSPGSSSHTNSTSLSSTPVAMETPMNSAKSCIQQPNIYIDSEFASCDICHKQFFSKDDLHAHRNTHHLSGGDPSSMNNTMNMESPHPQMTPGQYGPSYCNISSDKSYQPREPPQAQFSPNKPLGMYPNSAGPPGNNMGNKMYYDGGNVAMPEHMRLDNPDCCNMSMSNLSPCEVCGKEISCPQEMLQHAQCHKGVFNCEYCPKEFGSNSALLVHRRVHTGETPYKCDFCDRGFKQAPHLDVHLRTHTGEMPFQCLYCDKKFTQNSNKNRHQRTHFLGDAASGFNSPNAMNPGLSVNPENNENLYTNNLKCELCGCVFADRNSFVDHMLSHQSSSGNVGVMSDNQKPSTLTHGLTHLYQCTYCNAGFSCQPSLDNHVAMSHNGKIGVMPNNNSDCGMQFGQQQPPENPNHMKNNQRRPMDYGNMPHLGNPSEMGNNGPPGDSNNYMHSQQSNFYDMGNNGIASGGGSGEASSNGQEVYGGYGSNREPVVNMDCEFCQKNFKSLSSLMIHRRIHTGEAPFECNFCHRAFKQNVHLEVHMRTHTGETPFKCEFCDKRFTQKSNRDRHQRTHLVDAVSLQNSEMDYPMENVERKDATPASADQNSNTEHYNCDVCSSVFTNRDDFTDHRSCHDIPRLTEDSRRPYNRRKYDNVNVNPNEARAAGGEGVYKCDLCGCYFSNVSDLRHHQNTQHSQDSYFQRDSLGNGTNGSCSQYPVNVDSYNYQPEPKRYCSERSYPHHGSGYQERDVTPMSGPMPPPNMSFQGRNESGYIRPEENSFCEMGNNYCNSQKRPGGPPPQMPSHHGDLVSASPMGKGDNETQHVCNFCQRGFRSMSALLVHQRIHTGETPFQCDCCQKCFRQNAHLDVHLRTHTKETPFKCEFCDKQFTQNCNRNRHQRTHMGDPVSSQGQVDTYSSSNTSGGNASYSCDVCPLEFNNHDDFTDHRSCHDIPKLSEDSTNQTIATRRGRRRTPIKSYVEIDDDDFDSEDDMPVSETSYGCSQCDEKCMGTNDRQRHMSHNVKSNHGRYQPQNSKVYRDNQKCSNYRQDCHQCEICSQKFFGEEELCQHRLTHMNNPYGAQMSGSCPSHPNTPSTTKHSDVCMMDVDKEGGNCGNMNRKYLTGNNCELCCKTFSSTSALTTHMRVHTGESPYKCDFCHRAFKQTAHLDVHMRVHTGETPFKCHYCDKRFTQKNNMMRHEKIHHGDGASQGNSMPVDTNMDSHCQTCQAQCQSRSNLSDHQMECPGTPDSVSDCDICCKESNVKADVCPYSEPHHNRNNPIVKSPKDNKIAMGNFDKKDMIKKYDCCQDSCPDAFHNKPDMKSKSSHFAMLPDQGPTPDFPTTPDPGPMESTALQLPYACRHCKIEFLNQEDLCDHEPQCEAANFIPPGTSGKFPPLDHSTEGEAVYLDDSQMLTPGHQCEFCQKVFKSFSSLSVHRRVHTGEAPFQCHFCQRRFKQNSHLEVHLRTHTDETPYRCEFCDKCFTQAGNRNRHQRTHFMDAVSLGPAEFNRLEQEDAENNPGDSSEHFEYQENDSRTEIPNSAENDDDDDDAGYDNGNNNDNGDGGRKEVDVPLAKNQKRKRGRPKGSRSYFKIERQPSPDSVKMELAEDVAALDESPDDPSGRPRTRSHSRLKNSSRKMSSANDMEKNFPCDICSLGFSSAEALSHHQLSVHEVVESGNKNDKDLLENPLSLSCEYCDKTFTNGSALSVHRRVHTGEAPFQCQYCHKSFKQNAHLDVHMRIHTGETPFQCAFCDKRFSQNCNRLRHQKTHFTNVTSGENGAVAAFNPDANADTAAASAFKCELCNQEFSTKHTFDNHVCVDHSYDDDVRPLLPSPDTDLQASSDDVKSIPSKDAMKVKDGWSETLNNDGFNKISDDLLTAAISEPDFPTSNKLIKEEKNSPQKEFCEIESNAHQFQSANDDGGESLCDENRTDNDDPLPEKQDISDSAKYGNFVCDFCPSRTFHTQAALLTHRRTHTGEAPYQCTYCSKSFKQVAHLDTHLRVHTGEKPYKCKYCKKSFTQKSNRNRHEQVHELSGKTRPSKGSVPEYRCELCDGYFADATDLDMHRCTMTAADEWSSHAGDTDISADSQNLPYTCNICGKEYSSRVRFEKHRQTHEHGRKEENMSPLMERNGQSGTSSATDQLTFFCEVCRQKFTDKTEYTDHIFMHISENPYQQNQGTTYKNSKDVHVDQIREVCYLCEHCQNEFYNKNDFHNHRCFKNTPNGKGPMNKVSSQNSENIDDVTYNSGEYGLGTSQSEDFPEGVQGLCSNNFFECEFCDKTFRNHSTMLIHRRVHTGEMPFKCKFCERCFKQNAHLEVHLRTHTGETPFHCRFCEKSFTQKGNRNRHERTHLVDAETDGENQSGTNGGGAGVISFEGQEENLHCHLCSVDFSTEDDLKEHLERQHPDDDESLASGFQPMGGGGSYLTTLKEEHEIYEREALSHNNYPTNLGNDRSLPPYPENPSMENLCDMELGLEDEQLVDNKQDASGQQLYDCEFCHKQLKSLSSLIVHRRVHTGEAPFKCKFCERCFKQSAHLEVHMRTHTGETPYKCDFCDKSFTQNSNRLRHQRLHFMDTTSIGDDNSGPTTDLLNDGGTKDQTDALADTSHLCL